MFSHFRTSLSRLCGALAAAAAAVVVLSATASAEDAAAIQSGMAIYRDVANCAFCHGWDGKGVVIEDEGFAGANLSLADIDQKGLVEIIRCGRTYTRMPRYSRAAWSKRETCYGMTEDDLAEANTGPPDRPDRIGEWLSDEQIALVAGYVLAFYVGQDMTFEKCQLYNGAGSAVCERFRD